MPVRPASLPTWLLALVAPAAAAPCQGAVPAADAAAAATPTGCGRCHPAVHDEWQGSAHARAFVDPLFQRALASRQRRDWCLPCHVPDRVLDRLGQMPRARADRHAAGVDCASCHLRGEAVHGPNGDTGQAAPHPTVADPAFGKAGSTGLCASCHDMRIADVLPLAREFRAAGLRQEGESCVGCHMEPVRRAPAVDPASGAPVGAERGGRNHRLLGPGDPEFCATAFVLTTDRGPDGPELRLRSGAGHGVPGLARLRAFPVRVHLLDRAGDVLHRTEFTISWHDRLLVDEDRRVALPRLDGAVALRVQVDHVFAGNAPVPVLDRTLELP
ncbi:MAG: multiheme c-type cytochrome [Planctomycetota bacterium]